jgi:hypothetical protein
MPETARHSLWTNIASYAISAIIGAVFSAFVLGRNAQKINEVVEWKKEAVPRIERMDRSGTTSFDLFHAEYQRTQIRQEDHLKDLDKRVRDLERKIDP